MKAIVPVSVALSPVARLVEGFFDHLKESSKSSYRSRLRGFARHLGVATLPEAAKKLVGSGPGSANALVFAYRSALVADKHPPSTVNAHLTAIRELVKFGRTTGFIRWTLEVPDLKTKPYRDTRGPGAQGVRAMLAQLATPTPTPKSLRDTAIVRLLYARGLRRAEVTSLDLEHLDLATGTVSVLGKGRWERETFTLGPPTVAALKAWVDARGDAPGPLFHNLDRGHEHKRMTGQAIYSVVKHLGDTVGVRARPHGLRHAGITAGLDIGQDLRSMQRFSRHADPKTLMLYDDSREDLGGRVARLIDEAVTP